MEIFSLSTKILNESKNVYWDWLFLGEKNPAFSKTIWTNSQFENSSDLSPLKYYSTLIPSQKQTFKELHSTSPDERSVQSYWKT